MFIYHLTLRVYDCDDSGDDHVADAVKAAVEHSTAREALEEAISATLGRHDLPPEQSPVVDLEMTPWPE